MTSKALAFATIVMFALSITTGTAHADVALESAGPSGVVAKITPLATDTGMKKFYACAMLGGALYCRNGRSNWAAYNGGAIPVAEQRVLLPGQAAFDVPITGMDISALVGLKIYVAYGATEEEALTVPGHLALIYTVPEPPAPVPTVLHYTDKVYALWTGAYPYAVTRTGVMKLANKTQYTAGFYPLANCWIAERPLVDGRILVNCQDAMSLMRHLLYIDPTRDELYEYDDIILTWDTTPLGAGVCGWCRFADQPTGTVWHDVQRYDASFPTWSAKARVADGWHFTTNTVTWVLNFQDNTGAVTVVTPGTTFEVNETIRWLGSYTN